MTCFKFIDICCGIGGLRKPFDEIGGECVFSSDVDEFALKTYKANFTHDHIIQGDILKVPVKSIPNHDVLLAGFPCQPFSSAGVSKRNSLGIASGFDDMAKGTIFFKICKILKHHSPRVVVLENVKNLIHHDGGNTFKVILKMLNSLDYVVKWKVLSSEMFVPQKRERIVIVCLKKAAGDFDWDMFQHPKSGPKLSKILLKGVDEKYTLGAKTWVALKAHKEKHRLSGNGFGYSIVTPKDVARTLSSRYHKDGSEILVSRGTGKRPRRLTPRECARLMGFDDDFIIPVSDTQAYIQFGNSVVVPMFREVARMLKKFIVME